MKDKTENPQDFLDPSSAPGESGGSDSKSIGEIITETLTWKSADIFTNIMESVIASRNERAELAIQIDNRVNDKNLRIEQKQQKLLKLQEEHLELVEKRKMNEAAEELKKAECSSLENSMMLVNEKMKAKIAWNSTLHDQIEYMISTMKHIKQATPHEAGSQPAGSADQFEKPEDSTVVASLHILPITASGENFEVTPSDFNQQLGIIKLCRSILHFVCEEQKVEIPDNTVPTADFQSFIEKLNTAIEEMKRKPKHNDANSKKMEDLNSPKCSFELAESILAVSRQLAIPDEKVLRGNGRGSDIYGEASLEQMSIFMKQLTDEKKKDDSTKKTNEEDEQMKGKNKEKKDEVFIDLGSGFGQLCCLVSAIAPVKETIGIENNKERYKAGMKHKEQFERIMKFFGKNHSEISLILGDLEKHKTKITSTPTIIFVNNQAFDTELMGKIKIILEACDDGTKVISSAEIVSEKSNVLWRNEPFVRMSVERTLTLVDGNALWFPGREWKYHLREVDRNRSTPVWNSKNSK